MDTEDSLTGFASILMGGRNRRLGTFLGTFQALFRNLSGTDAIFDKRNDLENPRNKEGNLLYGSHI